MKKMIIVLMVIAMSYYDQGYAGLDNSLIQKENLLKHKESDFLDINQSGEEYNDSIDQHTINEYDQYVCDDIQPPKISAVRAMLTELLGALLVRYITMREMARIYFKEFKDTVSKWF